MEGGDVVQLVHAVAFDKKVQIAIVVVIEEVSAEAFFGFAYASLFGDVGELVAIIAEKQVERTFS